jgi:hypothetical protein
VSNENLTTFDPRFAELAWQTDHWELVCLGKLVKRFDNRQLEAQEAARIIRELGLTQHGTIGSPRPVMEYWLIDGRPPSGTTSNLQVLAFDPAALVVQEVRGRWCVCDARRVYFNFGSHADDAQRCLDVILRHGFNQVGFVGQPLPAMIYFLASRSDEDENVAAAPRHVAPPSPKVRVAGSAEADPRIPSTRLTATAQPRVPLSSATYSLLPDPAALAERVPFDWRQVRVRRENGEWQLNLGGHTLARFGDHERDAYLALTAIQHYRFTEQALVGKPTPRFSYFLVNGQAPRGLMHGVDSVPFRPERLVVQPVGRDYVLTEDGRQLLNLGDRSEDARATLQAIHRLKCDRLCRIGAPQSGGMTFFVRTQ